MKNIKIIKNIISFVFAIGVIPVIIFAVKDITDLKGVKNVQFELLSEEDDNFFITSGTYNKLIENKKIINYDIETNYPLITQEEMDRATWKIDDDLKNEIYIDENGQKRIIERVGKITFDGDEDWIYAGSQDAGDTIRFHTNTDYFPHIKGTIDNYVNSFGFDQYDHVDAPRSFEGIAITGNIRIRINKDRITGYSDGLSHGEKTELFKHFLSQNPLTITYELVVKNPMTKVIESSDLTITPNYVSLIKPNDFSNNPEGLLIGSLIDYIDKFEITTDWIYVYPKDITVAELRDRLVGKTLTYELVQPRHVEVYDFSTFKLTYDKNRIRVLFDIDDEYYLWEITKDDRLIPINGQYDLGNVWTVKYYVYKIQQPLIRSLVLLIPIIFISGLLIYLKKNNFDKFDK